MSCPKLTKADRAKFTAVFKDTWNKASAALKTAGVDLSKLAAAAKADGAACVRRTGKGGGKKRQAGGVVVRLTANQARFLIYLMMIFIVAFLVWSGYSLHSHLAGMPEKDGSWTEWGTRGMANFQYLNAMWGQGGCDTLWEQVAGPWYLGSRACVPYRYGRGWVVDVLSGTTEQRGLALASLAGAAGFLLGGGARARVQGVTRWVDGIAGEIAAPTAIAAPPAPRALPPPLARQTLEYAQAAPPLPWRSYAETITHAQARPRGTVAGRGTMVRPTRAEPKIVEIQDEVKDDGDDRGPGLPTQRGTTWYGTKTYKGGKRRGRRTVRKWGRHTPQQRVAIRTRRRRRHQKLLKEVRELRKKVGSRKTGRTRRTRRKPGKPWVPNQYQWNIMHNPLWAARHMKAVHAARRSRGQRRLEKERQQKLRKTRRRRRN